MNDKPLVVWFKDVDKEDISLVGGKGANLGEMAKAGFPVPNGFIVTAPAYFYFLEENKLLPKIQTILGSINCNKTESIEQASMKIQRLITRGRVPEDLARQIFKFYKSLGGVLHWALVAVRSSATAEDLPTASFAGLQETYLNIKGEANLLEAIKKGWASLFTPRAISYRHEKKFVNKKIGIAIVVQKMVQSEISGVAFTIDPVTNDKNKIVIEAVFGLGELIVQGEVQPDHYELNKKTFELENLSISPQRVKLVKSGNKNKIVMLDKRSINKQKLTERELKKLAKITKKLEQHYYFPQDVEWAVEKGRIYIVQTRPVTTVVEGGKLKVEKEKLPKLSTLNSQLSIILRGDPASPGIATGVVKIIHRPSEINKVASGDILVAPKTNPDYVTAMKKAAGIVTDSGGRTSHAAIVSRELGIPAIVGTKTGTSELKNGMIITINGRTGEIFKGSVAIKTMTNGELKKPIKTATRLYVNLSSPERAQEVARANVDGVGLLRAEFMLSKIGVHPKKLIREGKEKKFVNYLTDGLRIFCENFNPRPVIYRTTDFKSNEYKNLAGGKLFEPEEENPMLGYRGAFRYIHDPEVFNLELKAIKIVREELNLRNLWLMLPYVRTVNELIKVEKVIAKAGLLGHDFKLFMMVEIPSNVILIDEFIKAGDIDGISIGSNDLTMLILGTDRDNSDVGREFDELNPAVLWAIERVLRSCKQHHILSSICGEAPTVHPEIIEKLIEWGISSISIEADSIERSRELIAAAEKKFIKKRIAHSYV